MATSEQETSSVPVQETTPVEEHAHSCDDPSHHHHHDHSQPNFFNASDLFSSLNTATKNEQSTKRKVKKNRQPNTVRAETIPGNRGTENIDDLVKFINGPATAIPEKKSKKKSAN